MDGLTNILMYAANESFYIGRLHLYATGISALLLTQFVRTTLSEWHVVFPFVPITYFVICARHFRIPPRKDEKDWLSAMDRPASWIHQRHPSSGLNTGNQCGGYAGELD